MFNRSERVSSLQALNYIPLHLCRSVACPKRWTGPSCQIGTLTSGPTGPHPPSVVKFDPILSGCPRLWTQEPSLHRSSTEPTPQQRGQASPHSHLSKVTGTVSFGQNWNNWIRLILQASSQGKKFEPNWRKKANSDSEPCGTGLEIKAGSLW